MRSLCKTLLAFALLHFVLQGQTCLLLQASLDFLLLHSSPLIMKKTYFWVLVLEGLVGRIELLSFFSITSWGIDLDYCDIECFALEKTEIILLFLRLHPSTALQTLLLTMRATLFLLRDSCPQYIQI